MPQRAYFYARTGHETRSLPQLHGLAGTEGADANTLLPDFEVTDSLIQSMIELARGMRKLGVRDVNGTLTYEEDNL